MYSLKAILEKEPVVIAGGLRAILSVLVLAGILSFGEELLAGIYLGAEVLLTLFVRQTSTSISSPTLPANTEVSVQGTEDTVVIQPTPPGPTGADGGGS